MDGINKTLNVMKQHNIQEFAKYENSRETKLNQSTRNSLGHETGSRGFVRRPFIHHSYTPLLSPRGYM